MNEVFPSRSWWLDTLRIVIAAGIGAFGGIRAHIALTEHRLDAVERTQEQVRSAIYGNGQPGLKYRLTRVEEKVTGLERRVGQVEDRQP